MGYSTDFSGRFELDKPLTQAQAEYLRAFAETRRMRRDSRKARLLPDPKREAVGLPIGPEGAYFVGGSGFMGQGEDESVLDHNRPPVGQPELWCQWVPTDQNDGIEWDGGEKFYSYVEWIKYLIEHFLKPWGRTLNGSVEWFGEERDDMGMIKIENNQVKIAGIKRVAGPYRDA